MPLDGVIVVRVVEDEPLIALWLREAIHLHDANIKVVTSTDHFERLLAPGPWEDIDVALVDLMLPGISGLDILRYLGEVHPQIRRVVWTASTPHAEDARALSDTRVLIKPTDVEDVIAAIEGDQ